VYLGGGVVPARAQEASPSLPDSVSHKVSARDPDRYGPVTDSLLSARCEGLPIRRVEVRCLDIFDPVPAGRMSGFYNLANQLHVRTRERTLRSQLLLAVGDVWRAERVHETERQLRGLEYIEPDPVLSKRTGDSVDVLVVTHDQWTTQPELNLERGGGRTYGSVGFHERNLFGLGVGLAFAFREDPTGQTRTGSISGRRLFGTQLEGQYQAGTGRGGVSNAVSLKDPFRSLDDPLSWTVSLWRADFNHQLFKDGSLAAEFPFAFQLTNFEWSTGSRTPDGLVRRSSGTTARTGRPRTSRASRARSRAATRS
jgi:outer membrane protein assembly factor BamA